MTTRRPAGKILQTETLEITCKQCGQNGPWVCIIGDSEIDAPKYCLKCEQANLAAKEKIKHLATARELAPPLYRFNDSDRFPAAAWSKLQRWDGTRPLYIHGDPGTGKTRMAYQRLIELSAEKQIKRVKAYNVVELADLLRNQWRDTHTQEAQALFAANVLFIDDIEKARNSEFMLEQLYGIIEHFVSRQRVIVITSNKSPDALLPWLGEVFGETIYRRISEFFQIVRTS